MELPTSVENQIEELKKSMKLTKKDIEKVRALAESQYEKARITPGEAIGIVTGQSLGEPGTQLSMRTKWMSGAAEVSVTRGLPRIIEIFDGRKSATTPTMIVALKKSAASSEAKVESIALRLLEVMLGDISKEMNVDLLRMRIEIELDSAKMKHYGITEKQINDKVANAFKTYKITTGELKINIKPKEEEGEVDIKKLYKFRVKLKELHVSGIKGVTQVLPIRQGETWVIKTAGSNLRDVLSMKEIDAENTYTNDIYETYEVLGIEAARNLIIGEVLAVLADQGVELNPRHVMLIADAMTSTGRILPIGRYGLSGLKQSVLARASFEVPLKHLFGAAMIGEVDNLTSVIENVMLNQPVPIGTGIVTLKVKRNEEEK